MKNRRAQAKSLKFSITLFIVFLPVWFGCSNSSDKEQGTQLIVEKEAPPGNHGLPKMLDFGSDYCLPCKIMEPILDSLKEEYHGKAEIIYVDIRRDRRAARYYGITFIPTQIFFDADGNEVYRHVGFFPADSITSQLEALGADL